MARDRPARRRGLRQGLSVGVRRRWLLVPALVAIVPALAACNQPVGGTSAHNVAWVTTGASVTLPGTGVTPVNLARRHVEAEVTVGSLPSALAYAPGGKDLLVVTQGDDQLHEIDTTTHQVVHEVGVGVEPDAVAVAPGGSGGKGVALVANLDTNSVTPVDLGTWRAGTPDRRRNRAGGDRRCGGGLGYRHRLRGRLREQHRDADRRRHHAARRGHPRRPDTTDHRRRARGGARRATSATGRSPPSTPARCRRVGPSRSR